jgi:NarL family two-component system response regulator YdfI
METTRVLVAAFSPVVRAGLEALINTSQGLAVVVNSSDDATLSQQVEDLQPDVLLIETGRPRDESITELFNSDRGSRPPSIVVLDDGHEESWTTASLRSGVRAILPRDATADEIVASIKAAAVGLVVLHPEAFESLLTQLPSSMRGALPASTNETLTPREIEVLGMIAEGLGNKTIAYRLGISEHTVKFHVGSIFTKLDASSRTEAVTIGIRQGLIML